MEKVKYLLTSAQNSVLRKGLSCPSCGGNRSTIVAKKYFVTALRRCDECQLLFRTPTTSAKNGAAFYQEHYSQGFTTDCPSDEQLRQLTASGFKNTEKDFSPYIEIIRAAGSSEGSSLFDFGCSWGYGSWQFTQRGFNVESYEVSLPRAAYARQKLEVKVHASTADVRNTFDVFFSSHVLEHVPSVKDAIEFGMRILKPGGLFVALTPNGSAPFRRENAKAWSQLWGMVHPNFLDDCYYRTTFAGKFFLLSSDPYQLHQIKLWCRGGSPRLPLAGNELLLLARK